MTITVNDLVEIAEESDHGHPLGDEEEREEPETKPEKPKGRKVILD